MAMWVSGLELLVLVTEDTYSHNPPETDLMSTDGKTKHKASLGVLKPSFLDSLIP